VQQCEEDLPPTVESEIVLGHVKWVVGERGARVCAALMLRGHTIWMAENKTSCGWCPPLSAFAWWGGAEKRVRALGRWEG